MYFHDSSVQYRTKALYFLLRKTVYNLINTFTSENLDRTRKTQLPIKNPEAGEAYLVNKPASCEFTKFLSVQCIGTAYNNIDDNNKDKNYD